MQNIWDDKGIAKFVYIYNLVTGLQYLEFLTFPHCLL